MSRAIACALVLLGAAIFGVTSASGHGDAPRAVLLRTPGGIHLPGAIAPPKATTRPPLTVSNPVLTPVVPPRKPAIVPPVGTTPAPVATHPAPVALPLPVVKPKQPVPTGDPTPVTPPHPTGDPSRPTGDPWKTPPPAPTGHPTGDPWKQPPPPPVTPPGPTGHPTGDPWKQPPPPPPTPTPTGTSDHTVCNGDCGTTAPVPAPVTSVATAPVPVAPVATPTPAPTPPIVLPVTKLPVPAFALAAPHHTKTTARVPSIGHVSAAEIALSSTPSASSTTSRSSGFATTTSNGTATTSTSTTGHGSSSASGSKSSHSGRAKPAPDNVPSVIYHFVQVIPNQVWLALVGSLTLAAVAFGVALRTRRVARRQAGKFAEVAAAALTDPLTSALNRRGFDEAVEREIARARRHGHRFVLAYIDVRGLKRVNDSEGHLAGDQLLKEVADLLKDCARADDVVGRIGGDEFGILLTEADGADAVTSRIDGQVPVRREALGFGPTWGLTIGTATFAEDGETLEELVAVADRRLYEKRGIELQPQG